MEAKKNKFDKNQKMKLFGIILVSAVTADKKVPPKTPEERLDQLRRHIDRLVTDHFAGCKKADQWGNKLRGLPNRAQAAYDRNDRPCSFFDDSVEHGGPEPEDDDQDVRYSETDAVASVNGITAGIRKWSQRYLAACGGQKNHEHIVNHANKWRSKLLAKTDESGMVTC